MFVPTQSSITGDVAAGQLHIFPDAPSELAARFRGDQGLREVMRVRPARINRRIHILAINHRTAVLQSDEVRQGISAAINRDAILKEVYRPGDEKAHAALTGPFPVRSWATPPGTQSALSKPGGGGLIHHGLANRPARLGLLFEKGDPKLKAVCELI